MSVLTVVDGEMGSGKTYGTVQRLVKELIYNDTKFYTTLPLNIEPIVKYVLKRKKKATAEQIRARLKVVPEAEVLRWQKGKSGPWEYFHSKNMDGFHVIIDEAHNYIGSDIKDKVEFPMPDGDVVIKTIPVAWRNWIAEIRHSGFTLEIITQSYKNLEWAIMRVCGRVYNYVSTEKYQDPLFSITYECWYELFACYTRHYQHSCVEQILVKKDGKTWKPMDDTAPRRIEFNSEIYKLYNSFATTTGGTKGISVKKRRFQQLGFLGTHRWFFSQNPGKIISRACIAAIILWVIPFGGWVTLKDWAITGMKGGLAIAYKSKPKNAAGESETNGAGDNTVELPDGRLVELGEGVSNDVEPTTKSIVKVQLTQSAQINADIEGLEEQLKQRDEQIEQVEAERDKLELAAMKQSEIVMMSPDYVILRSGEILKPYQRIENGPFKGLRVAFIDLQKRAVLLDNGVLLQLSRLPSADGFSFVSDAVENVKLEPTL